MSPRPARKLRCAIYTRKSSEEGLEREFNSLHAHREAGLAHIASQKSKGWIALPDHYDDGGISGGTLERPALKRLLRDVEAGLIDVVVVYKIDRLSRSLTDFAKLVEVFERQNVTFVSVTQQFNTTTSMGQLMLNILLSFAQFEREVVGERVQDKFSASRRTPEALVLWLDRQVRQSDIQQRELLRWLRDLVGHLINTRGMHIAALMRCKFILARKVRERLAAIRQKERDRVYQRYLFAPEAKVEVSFDEAFTFKEGMYWDQRRYRGRWKPLKHFRGPDRVPAFGGADDGEEFQCAQAIDSLPSVKFWIRNVARHPNSFWLPTAADKFYPDFVAQLEDGRLLVVEYKGAHLVEAADTAEKRIIGRLWENRSGGRGMFVVVEKQLDGRDMRQQLLAKIGCD